MIYKKNIMPSLKFRIVLDNIKDQEIFRDITINAEDNFLNFYQSIIQSFGFEDDQMASFFMSDEDWNKGKEITLMDMAFDDHGDTPLTMSDENIQNFIEGPNQKLILVYDFMNMWIFLIELQMLVKETVKSPIVNLSVGELTDDIKLKAQQNALDIQFETEKEDAFDFDSDFDDDFEQGFENIDDYDL